MLSHEALILKTVQLRRVHKGAGLVQTKRGKKSGGKFCLLTEELVQASNKRCVCGFPLLMQF